jgi:hypothetical protein
MIAEGMANGKLLPREAESLSSVVASFVKTLEVTDLEDRLVALEKDASREQRYDA